MIYIMIGASVILVIAAILLLVTLMKDTSSDRKSAKDNETEHISNSVKIDKIDKTDIVDRVNSVEESVMEEVSEPATTDEVESITVDELKSEVIEPVIATENADETEDLKIIVNGINSVVEGIQQEEIHGEVVMPNETIPEVVETVAVAEKIPEVVETADIIDEIEEIADATAVTEVIEEVDKTNGMEIEPDVAAEEPASAPIIKENNANVHDISGEIIEALEKLSFEADDLRAKTIHLAEQTISLNKEKMQLALEKEQLKEEKNQLTEEKIQLTEEKEQLAAENKSIKLEANALESLLQEKYIQIEELENVIAGPDECVVEYPPAYDVRTAIRGILPDLQAMANEAMVDFSLKIDEIKTPFAIFDKDLVNNMILRMVFSGLRYSNPGGKLIFSISQINSFARDYAEYVYTCVYLGEKVDFYSEEAAALGGVVDIQRTSDGGVSLSVRVKFKIEKPDYSYLDAKIEQMVEQ